MIRKKKQRLRRMLRQLLKIVLPKSVYCRYIDQKHILEYRHTVKNNTSLIGSEYLLISTCPYCGYVDVKEY